MPQLLLLQLLLRNFVYYNSFDKAPTGTSSTTPKLSTGKVGGAYSFDGTNDFIQLPLENSQKMDHISLSAWILRKDSGDDRIICKAKGIQNEDMIYCLALLNGKLRGRITTDKGSLSIMSTALVPLNKWAHVAMIYNGSSLEIFIDGKSALKQNYSGNLVKTNHPIIIGNNSAGINRYFYGLIDEVKILNTGDISISELINGKISTPMVSSGPFVVKAISCKDNIASQVATVNYSLDQTAPPKPQITVASKSFRTPFTTEIKSSENTAIIRYTLDGSNPNCTNSTQYMGPITISKLTELRARSCDMAGNASTIASAKYTFDNMAPAITIASPKTGAEIQNSVNISGACESGLPVNLTVGTQKSVVNCSNKQYTSSANTSNFSSGNFTILAEQTDALGNLGRSSVTVKKVDPPAPVGTHPGQIVLIDKNTVCSEHKRKKSCGDIKFLQRKLRWLPWI